MKKSIWILAIIFAACTNEDGTRRALMNLGMTDIKIGGHAYWACSNDDCSCTEFTATNPQGDPEIYMIVRKK